MQKPTPPNPNDYGINANDVGKRSNRSILHLLDITEGCLTTAWALLAIIFSAIWFTRNPWLLYFGDEYFGWKLILSLVSLIVPFLIAGVFATMLTYTTAALMWLATAAFELWQLGNPLGYLRYRMAEARYEARMSDFRAHQRRQQTEFWRSLDGLRFEQEVGELFKRRGYKVNFPAATGDGGVDIIMRRGSDCAVVQCKAHASKVAVGVARELFASRIHFQASSALLVAASGVTKPTLDYCTKHDIQVLDTDDLVAMHCLA